MTAGDTITIEDFAKVEMRVGEVVEAGEVEGSDKLIRLVVDFGDEKRVVFTGIRKWYEGRELVGKRYVFVVNLAPKKMMGEVSQGMMLAVAGGEGKPVLVVPEAGDAEPG